VVKLFEIFEDKDCMYLVLELMTGGEVIKIYIFLPVHHSCLTELWKKNTIQKKKLQTPSSQSLMQSDTVTAWALFIEI
jgi:hypothetical protein